MVAIWDEMRYTSGRQGSKKEFYVDYSGIKYTFKLSTAEVPSCPFCTQVFGVSIDWDINHLIQHHKGKILHVGSESLNKGDEPSYYSTVAIVGFAEEPLKRESSGRFSAQMPPKD